MLYLAVLDSILILTSFGPSMTVFHPPRKVVLKFR